MSLYTLSLFTINSGRPSSFLRASFSKSSRSTFKSIKNGIIFFLCLLAREGNPLLAEDDCCTEFPRICKLSFLCLSRLLAWSLFGVGSGGFFSVLVFRVCMPDQFWYWVTGALQWVNKLSGMSCGLVFPSSIPCSMTLYCLFWSWLVFILFRAIAPYLLKLYYAVSSFLPFHIFLSFSQKPLVYR